MAVKLPNSADDVAACAVATLSMLLTPARTNLHIFIVCFVFSLSLCNSSLDQLLSLSASHGARARKGHAWVFPNACMYAYVLAFHLPFTFVSKHYASMQL